MHSRKISPQDSAEEIFDDLLAFGEEEQERLLTEGERASFMAPLMSTATFEFKPTAAEFVPTFLQTPSS